MHNLAKVVKPHFHVPLSAIKILQQRPVAALLSLVMDRITSIQQENRGVR